jgi:tetratricopeptide (TPR) repeat protein
MPSDPGTPESGSGPRQISGDEVGDLASALRFHKTGNLREAERFYRSVLEHNPRQPEALHMFGVLAAQTGNLKAAVGLIGRAIEVDRSKPDFHYNLGLTHQNLRDYDAAMECYRRTLDLQPKYAPALANLGNLLLLNEAAEEAEACYREAITLEPENPSHQINLGNTLLAQQAIELAEDCFREALRLKPDYAEALNGLGLAQCGMGRFGEAAESLHEALRHKPDNAPIHSNLGQVFFEQEKLEDAESCFRKALSFDPNYMKAKLRLARIHIDLDDLGAAQDIYDGILSDHPDSAPAWAGKANVLDHMRRTEEAYEIVRRFAQDGPPPPGLVHLYAALAQKEHRQADVAEELEGMLARPGLNRVDRRDLHFAAGRLYDRLGAIDDAFKHYEEGNRLRPTSFDPEGNADSFARRMAFYSAERLAELPRADNESDLPVFIVGMPRSGTSLVEQILSCHKDIYGAGELRAIKKLAVSLVPSFDKRNDEADAPVHVDQPLLNEAAERYLEQLRRTAGDAKRVTDKMPYNFLHLGLIALLFPRARVIHCVRDPIDTCLSCYFQNFARGNFSSFDLRHAGLYHRQYERLMAHWGEVLDLPILEVHYEEHIAEPERVCREMLDFLGLDWDPACLRFHDSGRFTKTASRDQVREPIYTSSAGRWRNYERHIGPLIEALGPEA